MNHLNRIITLLIFTMSLPILSYAQGPPDWNTQGNNIITNEWLGADAASTIALDIRHRGNYPILFSTNNTTRMRIASWGNVFVGYSGFTNPTARLHVGLTNLEAATGSNFESTAIRPDNRFESEGNVVNRAFRGISHAPNFGAEEFNGINYGGSFWAREAGANVGVLGVAS